MNKKREINMEPGRIEISPVLALYYPERDEYVGVHTKKREAVPGLLVFETIIALTLYQCAGSKHTEASPKILTLEEAREIVRSRQPQGGRGFQSLILYRPPHSFTVEHIGGPVVQ